MSGGPFSLQAELADLDQLILDLEGEQDINDEGGPNEAMQRVAVLDKVRVRLNRMTGALADLGEYARPDNWDDDEDPEQRAAWLRLDHALAPVSPI